jgi:pyruvate/2-oxoglutarate dehydrogenase complex dihydrolipoamide acyltransferase (E2) component
MPLTHVVHKGLRDDDVKRLPGELVDAMHWRTIAQLEDQRSVSPIPAGVTPVATVDGRWFTDRRFIDKYGFQEERPARAVEIVSADTSQPTPVPVDPEPQEPVAEVNATPQAKNLAEKHGIDLSTVTGTGPNGRIKKGDVIALTE